MPATADTTEDGAALKSAPQAPRREILTRKDLAAFHESDTCAEWLGFLQRLNDAATDVTLSQAARDRSAGVEAVLALLALIESWISEHPPERNVQSRFGSPSFRSWLDHVTEQMDEIQAPLTKLAAPGRAPWLPEAGAYLAAAFGDRQRIDYGTGHEASFVSWLFCLVRLGVVHSGPDDRALALRVFPRYLQVMRVLQETYWLEPAGSHGVWGLDDYHFLPFLFGSAQLAGHRHLRPKAIHDAQLVADMSSDYLYFACVQWVLSHKDAPGLAGNPHSLRWHSPMLDDISGVRSWQKVNSGMLKMYRAEVLDKLPIMQHFLFGSLLPFRGSAGAAAPEHEHVHALGQEFPTCCGHRIPSAVAAAAAPNASATVGAVSGGGPGPAAQRRGNVAETGHLRPPAAPLASPPQPRSVPVVPSRASGGAFIPFD